MINKAHDENLYDFTLVFIYMIQTSRNSAHVEPALLSYHVQNY